GTLLLSLDDAAPTETQFQFAKTFDLAEPDNFVDLTYVVSVEAIDASGDVQLANFDVTVVIGEGLEGNTVSGTSGDWQYAITTGYLQNFEEPGSDDGASDVGFVRAALSGADLENVAQVVLRLVPDDGGSDLDEEGDDGDAETVETPFIGAWHTWSATGTAGSGDLADGGEVAFDAEVAAAGDFEAPFGERDLISGLATDTGNLLNVSTELYGKILISGDPIEYDDED
ncbi:MAG: hypothetical protein AB8H79_05090, partial [Myxococcota bacterium]